MSADMTTSGLVKSITSMTPEMRRAIFVGLRDEGICTRCGAEARRTTYHKCGQTDVPNPEPK
jgi:hypothetical protein